MKKISLSLLIIFCFSTVHAQKLSSDQLIASFPDNQEKREFVKYIDSGQNLISLLLSKGIEENEVASYSSQLKNHLFALKQLPEPQNTRKKAKYIKTIFDRTHTRFLKRYELTSEFYQIFSAGTYNCVTACILYAHIFESLKIPYVIKETPTHVYLVAFPESNQVLVETTNPAEGFSQFSEQYKNSFVQNLLTNKMIDSKEYNSNSMTDLFDKYYFAKDEVTMRELVGIQYFNEALYSYENKQYVKSIDKAERAYFLYEKPKVKQTLIAMISEYLSIKKYEEWKQIELLNRLTNLDSIPLSEGLFAEEFKRISYLMVVENNQNSLYDSVYHYFAENIRSTTLMNEISYVYNYEKSRIAYGKGYYLKALENAKSAYRIKPKNADAELLLISSFQNVLQNETDVVKMDLLVSSLKEDYPTLMKNNIFGGIYLNTLLLKMKKAFDENKAGNGKELMEDVEETIQEKPAYNYNRRLLGTAYSKAGVYYFRRGNSREARRLFNNGLKLAPDDPEIKSRLYYLNN